MTVSGGELYDLGYQHYHGPREGRMRAGKALWVNGMRTVLGLGRPFSAKLFPWMFIGFVLGFAVILTIIVSSVGDIGDVPGAADYYQVVWFFLGLFAAVVAPGLLCPDRRERVITLYLVRPLTSTDYVIARWLVFLSLTLVVLYAGQAVLFVGSTLAAEAPLDYIRDNWLDVPRFLGAGLVLALFATTLALAAAAFTTRRAYAAAFLVGLFIISSVAAAALTECSEEYHEAQVEFGAGPQVPCDPLTGRAAKWLNLIGIVQAPIHVNDLIFDNENDGLGLRYMKELPYGVPIAWFALLVAGPGFALWWRYRRLVT